MEYRFGLKFGANAFKKSPDVSIGAVHTNTTK